MAKKPLDVEALTHEAASRRNIPTAEFESVMRAAEKSPIRLAYERRNRDLDPQLVWRGKDEQDWSDLIVQAPPLYIQEKVHPKVIIDDLKRRTQERRKETPGETIDLFADFNGLSESPAATEFYQHDQHWSNRMISGDSLAVMASLAERESLRGKVQCIYLDPPYGIKFNSNFQWSTTSRDVKDGAKDHVTREPEQVRAFRDTWKDGIHSYLTYLRDRLTVARDLLADSGSIFVQIGDENVHRVRALMDEVFGDENFVSQIAFKKTSGTGAAYLDNIYDIILWFARKQEQLKFRRPLQMKSDELLSSQYTGIDEVRREFGLGDSAFLPGDMSSQGSSDAGTYPFSLEGKIFDLPPNTHWKASRRGMPRLAKSSRLVGIGKRARYKRYADDFPIVTFNNTWDDTIISGYADPKVYVVQTSPKVVARCILMTTDPGDLVLDPTCGSGTTAYVAEQWGRRWITIDTSRVAIALARSRLMGARYPYYLLADSPEGQRKEWEAAGKGAHPASPATTTTSLRAEGEAIHVPDAAGGLLRSASNDGRLRGDIRHGFVYERVPHITLKSIANNTEIDVIWERLQPAVEAARAALNTALQGHPKPFKVTTGGRAGKTIDFRETGEVTLPSGEPAPAGGFMEWEIPRDAPDHWPASAKTALATFWEARIARQRAIDASIAARAEHEYLYDKPYVDNSKVRVAGPFTVESLSPHRTLAVDWDDELIEQRGVAEAGPAVPYDGPSPEKDFAGMILDNLRAAGVQQAHKEDRITFTSLKGWPGHFISAEGTFMEGDPAAGGKGDRPPAGEAAPAEASAQPTAVSARVKRAGIFIGPEFGTVARPDLVAAAREAGDAGFDLLIACAFSYDAHAADLDRLGALPILKARMNPDLHMATDLKATSAGNLFVVFGEPDIRIEPAGDDMIQVKVFGVDVFKPQSGEVVSEGTDGIALWMLDTDYNEESFFVRHAYFLGANDPYKALKTTLKAEIDEEAWSTLNSDTSRPFPKPTTGRIAVKVINHLGDEVMKVFKVG